MAKRRSRARGTTAPEQMPRYREIADLLVSDITRGRYPVGSLLPAEIALCRRHRISRFTAREALRLLREAGLVARRQGSGTQVIATHSSQRLTQSVASIADLLQYAHTTQLRLGTVTRVVSDQLLAEILRCRPGEQWFFTSGVRYEVPDGAPLCVTRVYLSPSLRRIEAHLSARKGAIYNVIEHAYDITFARVEQVISAVSLDRSDATSLNVAKGSPALRVIRYYYDGAGRLLEVADSLHPGERFAYSMSVTRNRPD